jgi:hypothetical protein
MSQDYAGIQNGAPRPDVLEAITQLGLSFRLMTQFTSFVAVEEMTVTDGGEPRKIEVPVEMPEGISHKGVFGNDEKLQVMAQLQRAPLARKAPAVVGGGRDAGVPAGRGESPKISLSAPPSASPAKVGKDSRSRRAGGGIGSGSGGGMGSGDGRGVGPGAGYSTVGAAPALGGGNGPRTPSPASAEELKRQERLSKMNPSIAALIDRLKDKNAQPSPGEAKFVHNGNADIQIWLLDKSSETMAQLKQLGFELVLDPKTAKMVIGRLPIEKLATLVELKSVRYVAPMTSR